MMFSNIRKNIYIILLGIVYICFIGSMSCYGVENRKVLLIYNENSYRSIIPLFYHMGFEVSTDNDSNFKNSLIDKFDNVIYYSEKFKQNSEIVKYINEKNKNSIFIEVDSYNFSDINSYVKNNSLHINNFTATDILKNTILSDYIHKFYEINDNDKPWFYIEIKNINGNYDYRVLENKLKDLEEYAESTVLSINPYFILSGIQYEIIDNNDLINTLRKAQNQGFIIAMENNIYIDDIKNFFDDYSYYENDIVRERRDALYNFARFRINNEIAKLASVGVYPIMASFSDNPDENIVDKKYNSEILFKENLKHFSIALSSEDFGYEFFNYNLNGNIISGKKLKIDKNNMPVLDAFIDRVNSKERGVFCIEIDENTDLQTLNDVVNKLYIKDIKEKDFSSIKGKVNVGKDYYEVKNGKAIVSDDVIKSIKDRLDKETIENWFDNMFFFISIGFAGFILIIVLIFIYITLRGRKKRKRNLFKE